MSENEESAPVPIYTSDVDISTSGDRIVVALCIDGERYELDANQAGQQASALMGGAVQAKMIPGLLAWALFAGSQPKTEAGRVAGQRILKSLKRTRRYVGAVGHVECVIDFDDEGITPLVSLHGEDGRKVLSVAPEVAKDIALSLLAGSHAAQMLSFALDELRDGLPTLDALEAFNELIAFLGIGSGVERHDEWTTEELS